MSEEGEKAIRILQFSGKKDDWLMWADKFMAKATIRGYDDILNGKLLATGELDEDGTTKKLSAGEVKANELNKKAYNELILSCSDKISFGIVKSSKTKHLPKGDAKEAWSNLKTRYEPNTGTELLALHKEYMSLEMTNVTEDPENFITELDELRARMKEEPFNEVIQDNSFMIHILNSLPVEYESVVETMEKDLAAGILTIESMKEQVRSKYKRLVKKMNLNDNELALNTQVKNTNGNKGQFKKRQGFKGTCRICGKYGHKAADCWENEKNKKKNEPKRFQGKCNYCGIYGHKEVDCRKKKKNTSTTSEKANLAETSEELMEDTVLISSEHQDIYERKQDTGFNDQVKAALMIEDMALGCWVEDDIDPNERDNEEEMFDPNEPNGENNEVDIEENEADTPRDPIPREFWTAVGHEIDRILTSNAMLLINTRTEQDTSNEPEWPPLPEMYRTEANVELDQQVRRGQVQTIDITVPLARAIRQTRDQMMQEALNQQDYERVRENLSQDTTSNVRVDFEDNITYRENDEEQTETQIRQDEMEIFGLNDNSSDENEEEKYGSDFALMALNNEGFSGVFKYDVLEDDTWIGDTGASTHMTNSEDGMFGCVLVTNQYIKVGSGERLEIVKKGCKKCTIMQKDGRKIQVTLYNVYYVPKLWYNLFSILEGLKRGWIIGNKGMHITLTKGKQMIEFDRLFKCPTGQLIGVKIKTIDDTGAVASTNNNDNLMLSYDVYHSRLMHANDEVLRRTGQRLGWKFNQKENKTTCISCAMGKSKQKKIPKTTHVKATRPGERLFVDISSMKNRSLGGSKFWALVVDDHTDFLWGKFFSKKSDLSKNILPILKQLFVKGKEVKYIRCDNAGENRTLEKDCIDEGLDITFEYTAPYSPQFNGRVERKFPTLYGKMRATFIHAGITHDEAQRYWCECANTLIKIENILIKAKGDKSASEKMNGRMPRYSENLHTFGEMAIIKDNGKKLKGKLKDRGIMGMFVGYADNHANNVFRFINLKTRNVMLSRDVTWLDRLYGEIYKTKDVEKDYNLNERANKDEYVEIDIEEQEQLKPPSKSTEKTGINARIPREVRNLQTSYNDAETIFKDSLDSGEQREFGGFALTTEEVEYPSEPTSFREAWDHPDPIEREGWRDAIRKEFHDMIKRGVWRRVKRTQVPSNRRTIGSKWVFKRKRDGRFRARLCGLGYTQIAGIDFTANYAPVINDVTLRILLVLKMLKNWNTELIDIETAFLHGDMEEIIYMNLPEGLNKIEGEEENDNSDCVILDKCIYGTVQAARQWNKKFKTTLQELGFTTNLVDPCLLSRTNENGTVHLCVYVDDVLLVGDGKAIKDAIKDIEKKFSIRKEGQLKDYLGCIIKFDDDGGVIHQPHSIKKLEDKFGNLVKDIRKSNLPSPPGLNLMRPKEEDELIDSNLQEKYRSGVGMLLYLIKYTRPDIANAVREHSKMMDKATPLHYKSLLRLIKYVLDTKEKGLRMNPRRNGDNLIDIEGYSDSDYAGDKDTRRSITGLVIYLCGVPISWKSKGQKAVTLSSTESEYYAMSELCTELIYIKHILEFLNVQMMYPMIVRVDNVGAMFLANNPALNQRTKHISVRQHFIREHVENGLIKIIFVKSKFNTADIFTKNLSQELYIRHSTNIMNRMIETENTKENETHEK